MVSHRRTDPDTPPAAPPSRRPESTRTEGGLEAGCHVIEETLPRLPAAPGVYRMLDRTGEVLYVGKAKNLRKRVANYAKPARLSLRIRRMVASTQALEVVTTPTETEALLLEADLIKRYKPRYNILLRDDKSFPAILVTGDHPYPQVLKHRGARTRKGDYFGPFASGWAVNETLAVLQRAFLLRSCSDTVFSSRTRPCLLHQIKRCSAPCVGRITQEDYIALVDQARAFLKGDSRRIQKRLATRMQEASDRLAFEEAAQYRDRIQALTRIQARQDIMLRGIEAADAIAAHQAGGQTCIQVFFLRAGQNFGNRAYFPSHAADASAGEVLEAFLGQFYATNPPPPLILLSHRLPAQSLVAEALSMRAERQVRLQVPQRGGKRAFIEHARINSREALGRRLAESSAQRRLLEGLAETLALESVPERIEVFDNSHIAGTNAVGAMIVAGPEGLMKNAYRKFTIRRCGPAPVLANGSPVATPGDDYAMMREVLTRRFARARKEDPDRIRGQWPDLVLVDGGPGQLGAAQGVFAELGIEDVALAAISKGPERNAGRERIHRPGHPPLVLEPRDPTLYFLQRLRDEAHRFAIGTHRAARAKRLSQSLLDEIPGIGPKRKKALLHHFGSAGAVAEASPTDLLAVAGISRDMAEKIHGWFHGAGSLE